MNWNNTGFEEYAGEEFNHNYCRDPNGLGNAWCYLDFPNMNLNEDGESI